MSTAGTSTLPTQPEEYRAILGTLCKVNWVAIAGALLIEVFIRVSADFTWPDWGYFSLSYNLVLFEFTAVNFLVMLLLRRTDWLDQAPRQALMRLRWLMLAVVALSGLHFLSFLALTGGFRGPLMMLLPPLLLSLYLLLPRQEAHPVAAIFLFGLLLVILTDGVTGAQHGMLSDAFQPGLDLPVPWLAVALTALVLSVWVGVHAASRMDQAGITLHQRTSLDPQTGLFSRAVLDRRIPGELARIGRSESSASLMMISFRNLHDVLPPGDYAGYDVVLREFADALLHSTRATSDTCARYDLSSFAALLPTASAETVQVVIERVQQCAATIHPGNNPAAGVELAIGVVSTSATSHAEHTGFVSAAIDALREAHSAGAGHQVVTRTL